MKNKKGFTLVEIIVVLVILAILASIALPYTLGYIDETKKAKDTLMAGNVLKAAQVMTTKYYELGDYYKERAYESVSNVVKAPSRNDDDSRRINEVYNKVVAGNEDLTPFKAIFVAEKGKVQIIRYKNLDKGIVYEWRKDNQKWKVVKENDPIGSDQWAIDTISDIQINDKRIWWNGHNPDSMPYIDDKYKLNE